MKPLLLLIAVAAVAPYGALQSSSPIRFEEVGEAAGVRTIHKTRTFKGPYADVLGMFTAGGLEVAVADYDNDGRDDLFVTNSAENARSRLFHNDGGLRFSDVTERAGVGGGNDARSIVADALWFDYDNDGWRDLLIVRFGTPILYRNRGDGRFTDVTSGSGLTTFANSIAAIAFDYDNDGRLDVLLGHYFPPVNLLELPTTKVLPQDLDNANNGGGVTLWRNVGGGRFTDVTREAGLEHHTGWTLDVGHGDFDNDGRQDVYLANDFGTDRLFMNQGGGRFRDVTETALGFDTKKGMNAEIADYDNDGRLDVMVTNIYDEYMKECAMLWHNNGDGTFTDLSRETGVCETLWGWAAKFADFDNDGWLDLFVTNGLKSAGPENYIPVLVKMITTPGVDFSDVRSWPLIGNMSWSGFQRKKLHRNLGDHTFQEIAADAGVNNDLDGRGLAITDFDGDGRLDMFQTNADQPALLYRGTAPRAGNWVQLSLIGRTTSDAVGARVTLTAGGRTQIREVDGGNGYAGQSMRRLHFGLGTATRVDAATVRWPDGQMETIAVGINTVTTARQGAATGDAMTIRASRLALTLLTTLAIIGVQPRAAENEQLWAHRNLGKAFYENPTTPHLAVEEFAKALALAPGSARERVNYGLALLRAGKTDEGVAELERVQRYDGSIPHTWFNLGIQYKKRGTAAATALAITQFEQMVALVPEEPISHYNLGYLYKISGRAADALRHFETASRLDPNLAGPRFQLYNAYRDPAVGRTEDAARELAAFQKLKKQQAGAVIPEDLDWSFFSEIWDPVDSATREPDPAPVPPTFRTREVASGFDPASAGLVLLPAGANQRPDAVAWSRAGVRVLAGGETPAAASGLEQLRDVAAVAPGDFDNDGLFDLAIVAGAGVTVWRATAPRTFVRHPATVPSGAFTTAFWFDHDHDYDVDLLLLGDSSHLLRNAGPAGFADATGEFPFVSGRALAVTAFEAIADTIGYDLVVSYADRPGVLYRDRLAGRYDALPLETLPAGARALHLLDFNHDSWLDLAVAGSDGPFVLLNKAGTLTREPLAVHQGAAFAAADFQNAGVVDLLAGDRLTRWGATGARDVAVAAAVARVAADFDADGRADLLAIDATGALRLSTNTSAASGRWVRIELEGVKNLKGAPGAEVEVKAGSRYLKAMYSGAPLLFGLGARESIDTVRITWPNGLIQNEPQQAVGRALRYKEAPRLSGSCPMIFAWDGGWFRFITDVLGVAPLGVGAGDGEYFPVDSDEVVHISGDALVPRDGSYEIRVTEELREVAYLDRIQLTAVDYPASTVLVTSEKFKAPPFPAFRLFGIEHQILPHAARDHRGVDLLDRVRALDRRYADTFARDFEGVAEQHALVLDFGNAAPANDATLVLTGWVDWADGSTFRGVAQEQQGGLGLPYLQVKDAQGRWQTVVEDMGLPAGKTKTIAVDLTGRFLSASREVRIVTNLCVYWDHVYLSTAVGALRSRLTPMPLRAADLRYHGFSRLVTDTARPQPEAFDYHDVQPVSMWNPTPGFYTRFGDVTPLLLGGDDELVVMGSGDEVRLRWDAAGLPPLPNGWRRDFLLLFEGYAKDGDANTVFSQSVAPLPFRGMSQYPYAEGERFPKAEYTRQYNTRPALRLLRPLVEGQSPK